MNRKKLYRILAITCFAGYLWIIFSHQVNKTMPQNQFDVCLVKQATSIPCPACGSTRSIESILHGDLKQAFLWNPIGYLVFGIMLFLPILLVFDILSKKEITFQIYQRFEALFKQKTVAIPAFLLVLGNWAWNIYKDV